MINFEGEKGRKLSAESVIYGALLTLAIIIAIFCVYVIAVTIKFISMVLGPVIFAIVTIGIILMILLGIVRCIKAKKAREKEGKDDA